MYTMQSPPQEKSWLLKFSKPRFLCLSKLSVLSQSTAPRVKLSTEVPLTKDSLKIICASKSDNLNKERTRPVLTSSHLGHE